MVGENRKGIGLLEARVILKSIKSLFGRAPLIDF
jgi:hypothetical protein